MILGADPATVAEDMQEVLDFEILLANVRIEFIFLNFFVKKKKANWETVLVFIVQASLSEIERHDTNCVYHKMTLASLKQLVPQIKWDIYLQVNENLLLRNS